MVAVFYLSSSFFLRNPKNRDFKKLSQGVFFVEEKEGEGEVESKNVLFFFFTQRLQKSLLKRCLLEEKKKKKDKPRRRRRRRRVGRNQKKKGRMLTFFPL